MPLPILGLLLLAGGAAVVLGTSGRRKASPAEAQVLSLVAKGYTVDQLEALGIGRVIGYEPGAGPGGWVGAGGAPPEPPVCFWDEVMQDCGPNPCPPDFPDCDPIPNCPPDQAWYSEFNACYPVGQQPGADAEPPKCGKKPPPELFCEDYENAICINGVWFCVKQLPPEPKAGEPCGREGYKGTIGQYSKGLLCDGTPGSLNGRWRRPKKGDPCPQSGIPKGLHCAFGELHETRAGSPCEQIGQWVVVEDAAPLFCTSAGRLTGIAEGNECRSWAPGGDGEWKSPDGELVCYQGTWRDTPSCVAAGTACAASLGLSRFHCWAGSPLNLAENRCAHG